MSRCYYCNAKDVELSSIGVCSDRDACGRRKRHGLECLCTVCCDAKSSDMIPKNALQEIAQLCIRHSLEYEIEGGAVRIMPLGSKALNRAVAATLEEMRPRIREETKQKLAEEWPISHASEEPAAKRVNIELPEHEQEKERRIRWENLLHAESRFRAAQTELLEAVEHLPLSQDVTEELKTLITEQRSRPSPDFRRLLLNTHRQLDVLAPLWMMPEISPQLAMCRAAFKEAYRLTDVERLDEEPRADERVIALRRAVDHAIGMLEQVERAAAEEPWDGEDLEAVRDLRAALTAARDDPKAFNEIWNEAEAAKREEKWIAYVASMNEKPS